MTPDPSALQAFWQRARAAWPDLDLPRDGFLAHVAQVLPADRDARATLETLHAGDLYLAYGCAIGDAGASTLGFGRLDTQLILSRKESTLTPCQPLRAMKPPICVR